MVDADLMTTEAIAFALLLAIALVPLVAVVTGRKVWAVGVGLLVALVAAPVASSWSARRSEDVRRQLALDQRPLEVRQDGYVSSTTCQACHPGPHDSWHDSYHRTMTQVAGPRTVVPEWDGVELTNEEGLHRLERRGDEYWAEVPDPHWRGGPEPRGRVDVRVVMLTGSHHYQVFWYPSGEHRVLWVFPFIYLIEDQRWIPRGAAFLGPEPKTKHILGVWNNSCIKCHSTHGVPKPEKGGTMDTRVAELGIACEACHGPAERHVLEHRDPRSRYALHRSDEPDPTIVQPGRLSHRASSQVCGQCHGVWRHNDGDSWRDWLVNGLRFRPGEELNDQVLVVRHGPQGESAQMQEFLARSPSYRMTRQFWSDGQVRVSGREYNGLVDTPCFEKGEMSCLSCHRMHQDADDPRTTEAWTDDQLAPGMRGDDACLQCHPSYAKELKKHTFHEVDSTGSRCLNCHMPYTTYGLLKAIRSHTVDSPTVAASLDTGRPNACNQCHLDETLAWSAKYLAEWYEQEAPELDRDEQSIAAGVLWATRGDAGQRALMAWSMGWEPARQASGADWMTPYLAQLLEDPYQAVRYIAYRSLRRSPELAGLEFDFVGPPAERRAAHPRALQLWSGAPEAGDALLFTDGELHRERFTRLLRQRDDRDVELHE